MSKLCMGSDWIAKLRNGVDRLKQIHQLSHTVHTLHTDPAHHMLSRRDGCIHGQLKHSQM